MILNNFFLRVFYMVPLVLLFNACEPEGDACIDPSNPECENYNQCYGKFPTTAEFTIAKQYFPSGSNNDVFINDDLVTAGGHLKFSAIPQEGAIYTWILGDDTIIGDYVITKSMMGLPIGTYNNSLIVTKPIDSICFPGDAGLDQFDRAFTKIRSCNAVVLGHYRGVLVNQSTDSVEIELALSPSLTSIEPCDTTSLIGVFYAVNFNFLGDTSKLNINGYVNTRISFISQSEGGIPEGEVIYYPSLNKIEAIYSINDVDFHFTGLKL